MKYTIRIGNAPPKVISQRQLDSLQLSGDYSVVFLNSNKKLKYPDWIYRKPEPTT